VRLHHAWGDLSVRGEPTTAGHIGVGGTMEIRTTVVTAHGH